MQFHPEVEHTQFGNDILKNFLYEMRHAKGDWSMKDYARSTVEALREKIGDGKVLLALSGGGGQQRGGCPAGPRGGR